jgi:hypothetical protein
MSDNPYKAPNSSCDAESPRLRQDGAARRSYPVLLLTLAALGGLAGRAIDQSYPFGLAVGALLGLAVGAAIASGFRARAACLKSQVRSNSKVDQRTGADLNDRKLATYFSRDGLFIANVADEADAAPIEEGHDNGRT